MTSYLSFVQIAERRRALRFGAFCRRGSECRWRRAGMQMWPRGSRGWPDR